MKIFKRKTADTKRSVLSIIMYPGLRQSIEQALSALPTLESVVKTTEDSIRDAGTLVNGSADIVLIEIDLKDPRADEALRKLNSYVGISGTLIVLAIDPEPGQVRDLFRMGVGDVLEISATSDEIVASIQSVLGKSGATSGPRVAGRIISIMKCGGGVGATMLATNMAHIISSRRKSASGRLPKTLVIDLDVQFGNAATTIKAEGKATLLDLLKAENRLDSSLMAAATRSITENMDLISAPQTIIPLSAMTPDFIEKLLGLAAQHYDYTFLDYPTAWSGWTAKSMELSDIIVPVLQPSVEHVTGAKRFLEGLDNLRIERSKSYFLINKISKGLASKDRINTINKVTRRPSLQVFEDIKTHTSARDQGELLHAVNGSASQLKNLSKCVDSLLAHMNTVETDIAHISQHETRFERESAR